MPPAEIPLRVRSKTATPRFCWKGRSFQSRLTRSASPTISYRHGPRKAHPVCSSCQDPSRFFYTRLQANVAHSTMRWLAQKVLIGLARVNVAQRKRPRKEAARRHSISGRSLPTRARNWPRNRRQRQKQLAAVAGTVLHLQQMRASCCNLLPAVLHVSR
jgi:hypothetical protein